MYKKKLYNIINIVLYFSNKNKMNYKTLKWMLESLVKVYKCPMCNAEINENNVDIVWAAGNTVNIDIECHKCNKHSMIKAEINSINLTSLNLQENWVEWLKKSLEQIKWNITKKSTIDTEQKDKITDKEIVDLNKKLKDTNLNASDLFNI